MAISMPSKQTTTQNKQKTPITTPEQAYLLQNLSMRGAYIERFIPPAIK